MPRLKYQKLYNLLLPDSHHGQMKVWKKCMFTSCTQKHSGSWKWLTVAKISSPRAGRSAGMNLRSVPLEGDAAVHEQRKEEKK